MYQAIVEFARLKTEEGDSCTPPPVFKMVDGEYGGFQEHAESMGVIWPAWTADESCPQEDTVLTDTETTIEGDYCALDWESTVEAVNQGCEIQEGPGCDGCACEECVCEFDSYCCSTAWDIYCVSKCREDCGGDCL